MKTLTVLSFLALFFVPVFKRSASSAEALAPAQPPASVNPLLEAAKAGNPDAQCDLGWHLEWPINWNTHPIEAKPKRMPEALAWYRVAADQGSPRGQYLLALCYLEAKGVSRDEEIGLQWIRKATDQNLPDALAKLAELYCRGIGEPRTDNERPIRLLERAADHKASEAYPQLVFHYQYGIGTDKDLITASAWVCRGALSRASGFSIRESFLRLQQGPPGGDNLPGTLRLYVAAADSHNVEAPLKIGQLFLAGDGVPANLATAWQWITLAAQRGAASAAGKILSIESRMSPAELDAARKSLPSLVQELNRIESFLAGRMDNRTP